MTKYKYEVVDIFQLKEEEKASLEKEILSILRSCFDIDETQFEKIIVERMAHLFSAEKIFRHKMMLVRDNKTKELLGYASARFYDRVYGGKQYAIFSPSVHLKSKFRGGNITTPFLMKQILRFNLKNIGRKIDVIGYAETSPAPYYGTVKHFRGVIPNKEVDDLSKFPKDYQEILLSLRKEFALSFCDETENPLVCKAIKLRQNTSSWKKRKEEAILFYLEMNPRFEEGYCLLMMNPCNLSDILYAMRSGMKDSLAKGLRIKKPNLQARKWVS